MTESFDLFKEFEREFDPTLAKAMAALLAIEAWSLPQRPEQQPVPRPTMYFDNPKSRDEL